jgi:hypothetical protein
MTAQAHFDGDLAANGHRHGGELPGHDLVEPRGDSFEAFCGHDLIGGLHLQELGLARHLLVLDVGHLEARHELAVAFAPAPRQQEHLSRRRGDCGDAVARDEVRGGDLRRHLGCQLEPWQVEGIEGLASDARAREQTEHALLAQERASRQARVPQHERVQRFRTAMCQGEIGAHPHADEADPDSSERTHELDGGGDIAHEATFFRPRGEAIERVAHRAVVEP